MKNYYLMLFVAISIVIGGCENQAKQQEIEKQRQEDSIRVVESVKKEFAEKEAKERAERERQEAAEKEAKERAERERQEAEEKERIEQDGFTTSASGVFSIKKVLESSYQDGVRGGGFCKRWGNPHAAGHGTEAYFKNRWTSSYGIPNNEKAKEVYNQALKEYLRGYNDGLNF